MINLYGRTISAEVNHQYGYLSSGPQLMAQNGRQRLPQLACMSGYSVISLLSHRDDQLLEGISDVVPPVRVWATVLVASFRVI